MFFECFFIFAYFALGCALGDHAIKITQFVGDFEKIKVNAMPGFVLNCDEYDQLSKCQHVEMTFTKNHSRNSQKTKLRAK